ncbi:MAG: tetratricopeptide repeat protein [Planctomycetota bacterium]|jgi:hypothetical protein
MPASEVDRKPPARLRRRLRSQAVRRTLALGFAFTLLLVFELTCRLLDIGRPELQDDPFVGFTDLQPTFVLSDDGSQFEIPEARLKFFAAEAFPARKPVSTRRIFCLGGSTVQGRPFSIPTSFTTWLEIALNAVDDESEWDVINCGGISYASYRLVPLLQECLRYEPDLFVVCTGHNEFLEDRTYSVIRDQLPVIGTPHRWLSPMRSYHVYRNLLLNLTSDHHPGEPQNVLKSDVDAFLDYHNGLAAYHRDRGWQRGVVRHFGVNLQRLITIAGHHDIPLLFVLPPSNLADQPPFKSQHRDDLTPDELARFDELMAEAQSLMRRDSAAALRKLQQARGIDPEFAELRYHLGRLHEVRREFDAARRELTAARDEDICPLRMISPLEEVMRNVADETDIPLLNAHALLERQSRNGILGGGQLVDHVHPSIEKHQTIALALLEQLAEHRHVVLPADWKVRVEPAFADHFESLTDFYFADGQRRLDGLRYWTRGEADGPEWPGPDE